MKTKQITLPTDATGIKIASTSDRQTDILFFSEKLRPDKKPCIQSVEGRWEIETTENNLVNLVNHDEIIKEDAIH